MENSQNQYFQIYRSLNIPIEPLPSNYTPEEYGKRLAAMSCTNKGVSYASSTDYKVALQATESKHKK